MSRDKPVTGVEFGPWSSYRLASLFRHDPPGTRQTMGTSAAYFDVDGTLVGTNLIHPTIVYLVNQATPMESVSKVGRALLNAPAMALAELRDRRLFNEMLFYHYKGMTEDRILSVSRQAYESVVVPRIFRGSKDLVAKCKDAGQRVVLITGSLNYIIEPLAEYLGADDIITNRVGCAVRWSQVPRRQG